MINFFDKATPGWRSHSLAAKQPARGALLKGKGGTPGKPTLFCDIYVFHYLVYRSTMLTESLSSLQYDWDK